jgi:demethylmenaquinone methyltransferase / 2-methoxy-6-polyprenyl-1,4-benzoquinol methylase
MVVPYKHDPTGKKVQVARMFDNISRHYDFLNHLLSLGIDKAWRRKAIRQLQAMDPRIILDVATGTGDFAVAALRLKPDKVIGIDISEGMLQVGRKKIADKGLTEKIHFQLADSEKLPFEENKFDAIIVGFGVRNFENLEQGLREMFRVLRPGGKVVILEFSKPKSFPFRHLYNFYFNFVLPKVGRWVSNDDAAYSYLPESVRAFPDGQEFTTILSGLGFKNTACTPLTFGISSLYTGSK